MLRNLKDAVRGGKLTKMRREEKRDPVAGFLSGRSLLLWSNLLWQLLPLKVPGEPEGT